MVAWRERFPSPTLAAYDAPHAHPQTHPQEESHMLANDMLPQLTADKTGTLEVRANTMLGALCGHICICAHPPQLRSKGGSISFPVSR